MAFDPRAKTIKQIQEAYENGEIDYDDVLAEYTERKNRPEKSKQWVLRYERAINALKENSNMFDAAFNRKVKKELKTKLIKPRVIEPVDSSDFEVGDVYTDVLLESFTNADRNSSSIEIKVKEVFPSNWKVRFPKKIREENPIGTQFSATVTVSASSIAPDDLFLKTNTKTIKVYSKITGEIISPIQNIPKKTKLSSQVLPELGKSGTIRKPSNLLTQLPSVFSPELKETFEVKDLESAETKIEEFLCALRSLIWEIRTNNKGKKTVNLTNGVKQPSLSGEYGVLYAFKFESDEELFEGARIDIQIASRKSKGSIASIFGSKIRTLVLACDEDCGAKIDNCSITQDDATFFEALQNRFEIESGYAGASKGKPVGMNLDLADDLLMGKSHKVNHSSKIKMEHSELNQGQIDFTQKLIKNSISFLWGPPGTGKTQTLGAGLSYFYDNAERSLITSNTNKAVDQVLLKLCRRLEKEGKISDLEEGKIVRVGKISHDELEKDFSTFVTVDGIVGRRGSEMQKKINSLENQRPELEARLSRLVIIFGDFEALELENTSLKSSAKKLEKIKNDVKKNISKVELLKGKVSKLEKEKSEHSKKGFIGKAFGKSIDLIENELSASNRSLNEEVVYQRELKSKSDKLLETIKIKKIKVKNLETKVKDKNINILSKDIDDLEVSLNKINAEVSQLNKEMESLRKNIISEALIVGATLTKTFLSPNDLGKFENVIVDEASMALLPAVYFVASQSQKRCIISGDFRQIPAIVQSKNKAILDILGDDIFKFSGMETAFENNKEGANAGVLTEQYRMDPKICALISDIGYSGRLTTANERKIEKYDCPKLFNDPIIIIDTSSIYPFCEKDPYNSKSNLTHALISRNIMRSFAEFPNSGNIGFCAPFRAQVKLMKKISEQEPYKDKVSIGTVHTFQGDEKATMIFDSVESLGEDRFIFIPHGQVSAAKSSTLTVAVSRAEQRLIFIANLRHLDNKIPAQGYFRHILYKAQQTGKVIDAQSVINLETLNTELSSYTDDFVELGLDVSKLNTGLADQDLFFKLLKNDIKNARKFIVIYSGFYTSNRVADLLVDLKNKIIKNKIKIKIIIPPPERNGSMDILDSKQVIKKLEEIGAVIEFRDKIHQKAVLIDENIVWFGSLNPLSYKSTLETMIRFDKPGLSNVFAESMATNKKYKKKVTSSIAETENPYCEIGGCGSKTIFMRGRNGSYYKCSECSKTQNIYS